MQEWKIQESKFVNFGNLDNLKVANFGKPWIYPDKLDISKDLADFFNLIFSF